MGTIETAASLTTDAPPRLRLGAARAAWTAAGLRAAMRRAGGGLRRRIDGRPRSSRTTTSRATSRASRTRSRRVDRDAVARAAAVLLLTLRGTPFLYYGEELGMGDVDIPPEESVDPPAARVSPDFAWWDRSRCRTPMPWTAGTGAGFTTGRPWLRLSTRHGDPQRRSAERPTRTPSCRSIAGSSRSGPRPRPSRSASLRLQPGEDAGVVAYTRESGGPGRCSWPSTRAATARSWRLPDVPDVRGWHVGAQRDRAPTTPAERPGAPGRTLDPRPERGAHPRGDALISTRGAPATMTSDPCQSARGAPRAARFPEAQGQRRRRAAARPSRRRPHRA